jgi:DNA processing protein
MHKITREQFPAQLLEIPQVPEHLYVVGNMPPPDYKLLCVVGSRHYTQYGKDATKKLIASLAGKNVAIISGLAKGIDTIAHQAALDAGLLTFAFPGSGLNDDVLHPQQNVELAHDIIDAGGGLISEYEPDTVAATWTFPQRNRIMAGFSQAVMVVEAGEKSGTLITSKLATDYNRDVFTVPGSIFSQNSFGPHMLIRLGATPITKPEDLHEALGFDVQLKLPNTQYEDCCEQEKKLLALLDEPLSKDELLFRSKMPISDATMYLSLLEMKGHIKERLGKIERVN